MAEGPPQRNTQSRRVVKVRSVRRENEMD